MPKISPVVVICFISSLFPAPVSAQVLSVYDIQYTADPNGTSPWHGAVIDCCGGIVIHKKPSPRARLTLYDPNQPDGWGGIMVKDLYSAGVFDDVSIGDWVALTNVEVEDFKGMTFLQYKSDHHPNLTVLSKNNPLPKPLPVHVAHIAAPVEDANTWVIADHTAEKYEAMLLKVIDVNVTALDYGKAYDNYVLTSNADADNSCWAADYLNEDATWKYHDLVQLGRRFCGVAGILEQYTAEKDGIYYDYYQLLTTGTDDFTTTQTADLDDDCDVDFADYAAFALHWYRQDCIAPDWCDGADLTENGYVDELDLKTLIEYWLEGR